MSEGDKSLEGMLLGALLGYPMLWLLNHYEPDAQGTGPTPDDPDRPAADDLAGRLARAAGAGVFLRLLRDGCPLTYGGPLRDYYLDSDPDWDAVKEALDLVERLDGLLATLEARTDGGQLARSCRDNLGLLPLLADWCDDRGRPLVAAELRHLDSLVRCSRL